MAVLECYFGETNRDEILRDFIVRGAYDLYIEAETGTTELVRWSGQGLESDRGRELS